MRTADLAVGTTKGLVMLCRTKDSEWEISDVHFNGMPISMFFEDERNGNWWVALSHRHWGPKLHMSEDKGRTWQRYDAPKFPDGAVLPTGRPAVLKKIWCMAPAMHSQHDGLWLGVEPGALFYVEDQSGKFELVRGLWEHASRQNPLEWFGAGRDYSYVHAIVTHPHQRDRVYIAVSCAGIFMSNDAGNTWHARNDGLIATYLPNPIAQVGHDPHALELCSTHPEAMWQQNHCGVFRTDNGGLTWENVTDVHGLANYGFALATDAEDPLKAWVIPAASDELRVAVDHALCVCATSDGGKTWQALRNGLPQEYCFDIVYRQGFARQSGAMVFGTSTGNLFASDDDGRRWTKIAGHLARIDSVSLLKNI